MDGEAFRERIGEAKATELDRLGSEKLLLALTGANLEREPVLRAAATSERAARETFEQWAAAEAEGHAADGNGGDRSGESRAASLFADLAEREAEHHERVVAQLDDAGVEAEAAPADDPEPADAAGPLHTYLRDRETTVERAAGLVGRGLVSDRTHLQAISFFVNEGDTDLADLFRDLRDETSDSTERGLALLDDACGTEEDWETATAVAEDAIQLAYDDFADELAGMGLDPKPIC